MIQRWLARRRWALPALNVRRLTGRRYLFGAASTVLAFTSVALAARGDTSTTVSGLTEELADKDKRVLVEVFSAAAVSSVHARSVERTPERQVRVMLDLAQRDLGRAKEMYCDAGDEVLSHYDPAASREANAAGMLRALITVLPKAREMGCLNHVRNEDVISVDVAVEEVPEPQRPALVRAAEVAVQAKKLVRFLAPPREPSAYHFEFERRAAVTSSSAKGD